MRSQLKINSWDGDSIVYDIIWAKRFDLMRFSYLSYLVPVLNQMQKMEIKIRKKGYYSVVRVLKVNF